MSDSLPTAVSPENLGDFLHICHEALRGSDVFYGHGTDNPWDEAVQLALWSAGLPADSGRDVLDTPIDPLQVQRGMALLKRRLDERIPLPYLLGKAWFAGLEFLCDERAIIPRSPIAELILNQYQPWYSGPEPHHILDLCCGGGCIGLAAAYYSDASVDLADIDSEALALAAENRDYFDLQARVSLFQSDLFSAVPAQRYDIILSNPPYVDASDLASMPEEFHHEPPLALGSGADGLDLTRQILATAESYLKPEGLLVVEVGNSWEALEAAYPGVPFAWLAFEQGGHGVFALTAAELREHRASLRR